MSFSCCYCFVCILSFCCYCFCCSFCFFLIKINKFYLKEPGHVCEKIACWNFLLQFEYADTHASSLSNQGFRLGGKLHCKYSKSSSISMHDFLGIPIKKKLNFISLFKKSDKSDLGCFLFYFFLGGGTEKLLKNDWIEFLIGFKCQLDLM